MENLKQNIAPLSPNKQTIKLLLCTKPQNISSLVTIIVSICENNCYLYGSKQTAIATARVAYHHKRATHHDTKFLISSTPVRLMPNYTKYSII